MKVLNLSTNITGGAGFAALRLHHNLRRFGVDSRLLTLSSHAASDRSAHIHSVPPTLRGMVAERMGRLATRYVFDSERYFPLGHACSAARIMSVLREIEFVPDLILCNWVSRFVSPQDIAELAGRFDAPVVWHMLDMAPFTGGCHYSFGCDAFEDACGHCPALWPRWDRDISAMQLARKQQVFESISLTPVATCEHLLKWASGAAVLRGRRVEKVLYGIDSQRFSPGDRDKAKERLGLPTGKPVIFAGSQGFGNRRKGTKQLFSALRHLADSIDKPLLVALAGDADGVDIPTGLPNLEFRWLGFLDMATSLIDAYRAADAFVCPSIEDAGPMMINEAIMCGTPVVSFDMGVAQDLVLPGVTGYRARLAEAADLAAGIEWIVNMSEPQQASLRVNCRNLGLAKLHPDVQAQQFVEIFTRALANRETSRCVTNG